MLAPLQSLALCSRFRGCTVGALEWLADDLHE